MPASPDRTAAPIPRKPILWTVFLLLAAALAGFGILNNPALREARLAKMSRGSLEAECHGPCGESLDAPLLYHLGKRLKEEGRTAEALPVLERALQIHPDDARIRDLLGQAQLTEGRFAQAYSQLRQFAETHPDSSDAHRMLGQFYLAMNAGKRCREQLETAVRLNPADGAAWSALAACLSDIVRNDSEATAAAQKAVALLPEDAGAHLQLAALLARSPDHSLSEKAPVEYERAIALAPERADVHRLYAAYLLDRATDTTAANRAEAEARRSLEREADSPLANLLLGRALSRQGRDPEAIAPLETSARLALNEPAAPLELSRLYRRQGDTQKATYWQDEATKRQQFKEQRRKLEDALDNRPGDPALLAELAHLLARHGEAVDAIRYQAKAQKRGRDDPAVLSAVRDDLLAGGFPEQAAILRQRIQESGASAPPHGESASPTPSP